MYVAVPAAVWAGGREPGAALHRCCQRIAHSDSAVVAWCVPLPPACTRRRQRRCACVRGRRYRCRCSI
eukprot:gene14507-biopygen17109